LERSVSFCVKRSCLAKSGLVADLGLGGLDTGVGGDPQAWTIELIGADGEYACRTPSPVSAWKSRESDC
jgi:hypothetical protein